MNWNRVVFFAGLMGLLLRGPLFPVAVAAQASGNVETQGVKNIRSLKQIRNEDVVRQRWDMSCGAAALSTVLTYDFKDDTPETAIVVWILHRVDPVKVRAQGGFSLLDLKHFAEARGYHAEGFSGMTIADLAAEKTSVITPIRLKGFDHFVVVKGVMDGRVILADPGFGNLTMRVERFQKLWRNGIGFIVHPPDDRMIGEKRPITASRLLPDETTISRSIGVSIPSNALY